MEFTVDPMFKKLQSTYEHGQAGGTMFLMNLDVRGENSDIIFASDYKAIDYQTKDLEKPKTVNIDNALGKEKKIIKVSPLPFGSICIRHKGRGGAYNFDFRIHMEHKGGSDSFIGLAIFQFFLCLPP